MKNRYRCLKCNKAYASIFAKDNVAQFGHICAQCFKVMYECEKSAYAVPSAKPVSIVETYR